MNRQPKARDAADATFFGDAPGSGGFFAMAVEEWWKLVAAVTHAFAGSPRCPADVIEEKRLGDQ
jgi:hypothetical protein